MGEAGLWACNSGGDRAKAVGINVWRVATEGEYSRVGLCQLSRLCEFCGETRDSSFRADER